MAIALVVVCGVPAWGTSWEEIQQIKAKDLALAAQHAMEQQKTAAGPTVSVRLDRGVSAEGGVTFTHGKHGALVLGVKAAPYTRGKMPTDLVRIKLPAPMDLYTDHSGFAIFATTAAGASAEVRAGMRFLTADGKTTQVEPALPVLSPWGDTTQELYFDWSYLDYAEAAQAVSVLKAVSTIEITFGAMRRTPERGPSTEARDAQITLSNLRLIDYLKGSYDTDRQSLKFDQGSGKWIPSGVYDLTLMHRTQEVSGIVARYGGAAGIQSAVESLDFAARTQCWDGSFIDTRRGPVTVASGEYTFGFTLFGLLQGYKELDRIHSPLLDEKITIGTVTNSRRWFYLRMFYRGALGRTATLPSAFRDDTIGGNTLVTGANRVLGYAIAMRMIADVLPDAAEKKLVLEKYGPIMQEIADAQGKYSAGFPILGEGDRFNGRGIHYDAGYTRTHMDWLVLGAMETHDPLLIQMLRRYQTVFEAVMDQKGSGLLPMHSERGHDYSSSVRLVIPDVTAQAGMEFHLPVIAQWGYNVGVSGWASAESQQWTHFYSAANHRGYTLGAHMSILLDDLHPDPAPRDLGYLFPRQYPIWSTRAYSKDGTLQRTSSMTFHPDGIQTSDYQIEVGEYPVTVGVPVMVKSAAKVTAIAESLSGWPGLLPADVSIQISGLEGGVITARLGQPVTLKLTLATRLVLTGPPIVLPPEAGGGTVPFRAELTLAPEQTGQTVELTVLRGTDPYSYTTAGNSAGPGR